MKDESEYKHNGWTLRLDGSAWQCPGCEVVFYIEGKMDEDTGYYEPADFEALVARKWKHEREGCDPGVVANLRLKGGL